MVDELGKPKIKKFKNKIYKKQENIKSVVSAKWRYKEKSVKIKKIN